MSTPEYYPEQLVESNGIMLNYDSFGKQTNPAIILIMGLGTQMIYWDEKFCNLLAAKGYWVIRFDNRDIGKSTKLERAAIPGGMSFFANLIFKRPLGAPYLLDTMADDVLGLMDSLGLGKANIVGTSMGGMIAQCVALKAGHRVVSLTSIMSTTGNRSLPKANLKLTGKLLAPLSHEQDKFLKQGVDIWKILHGERYPFDADKILRLLKHSRQRCFYPAGASRQLAAILDSPDRTPLLKGLRVPSLVLHGSADPLVPVAAGYATASAIPGARLKIYEGMGHTLPEALHEEMATDITNHILQAT